MTPPDLTLALRDYTAQALAIREAALGIKVTDAESLALATETLATCRVATKEMEKRRQEMVKPLNDEVRETNRLFGEVATPVKEADDHLSRQITTYQREQKRLADLEAARLKEERERLEREAAAKLLEADAAKATLDSAETLEDIFAASEQA